MPAFCDGCGAPTSLEYALDYGKGGLIIQRHNEVRDSLGNVAALAYSDVIKEPVVREADESNNNTALIADLSIQGVWQPQTEALLDIHVVDTDARSYLHRPVEAVLSSAERDKQCKYSEAVEARWAFFFPLVVSVDGVLRGEANYLLKRFADNLSQKWEKNHIVRL